MPTVTALKRQKKSATRFNIYLDGVYTFSLSDLELSNAGLRVGQELSSEEVEQYSRLAQDEGFYARALRFIGVRFRSSREVHDYLMRRDAPDSTVREVVARLERIGLLNDHQFAHEWIRNRLALRPRSKRVLEQELLAKGVSREIIAEALNGMDGDSEFEALQQVIEKKRRLPQYREEQKLISYLARQGYSYELIKRAVDSTTADN